MLSQESLDDIRTRLEGASCPVFLFDNDADGLCSYVIARRALGKGKGIPVRSYPELDVGYCEQALILGADMVVVLDKPFISEASIRLLQERSIPLLILDHHVVEKTYSPEIGSYPLEYNPALLEGSERSTEPVSYLMYCALGRKEDLWLMIAGCIADHYLPVEWEVFSVHYPALGGKVQSPFHAYYLTPLGTLAQSLNFGLKDSLAHVKALVTFLSECSGPEQVLGDEAPLSFRDKMHTLSEALERFIGEAQVHGSLVVVQYSGATSMSADIANKLSFLYPGNYILVAYCKGSVTNLSLRGKGVKKIFDALVPTFPGLLGGGHEDAVGGRMVSASVEGFIKAFQEKIA